MVCLCVFLIAAPPQTVSERTRCRYTTPCSPESASPDPAPRRSDSPPLSSAGDADMEGGERGQRDIMMEERGMEKKGSGISG